MAGTPLKWGILGTTFIADVMATAIQNSPYSRLHAVAGRDLQRTQVFQAKFPSAQLHINMEALLADPEVDVVYIALPNHVHHSWCVRAAAAGKHILCEKSLSIDMPKTQEMLAAVEASTGFFAEGLMYLAHPFTARIVELLQDGRLGALKSIQAHYAADIWQLVNPAGRGAIYNLGCYPVSLVQLVVQTMLGTDAFQARRSWGSGHVSAHDGNISEALLGLRFDAGVLASVHTAETHGMGWSFSVTGTQGTLQCISNPWLPTADDNELLWTPFNGAAERITVQAEGDAFDYQVRMVEQHVCQHARIAQRPSPRPSDSHEIMELLTDWETHARASAQAV